MEMWFMMIIFWVYRVVSRGACSNGDGVHDDDDHEKEPVLPVVVEELGEDDDDEGGEDDAHSLEMELTVNHHLDQLHLRFNHI